MLVLLLVLAGLGWWWSGPASDELVLYPAQCADGTPIIPLVLAMPLGTFGAQFEQYHEKHQQDRANCVIDPHVPDVFKLNETRGEVYYKYRVGETQRLVDCAIFSRTQLVLLISRWQWQSGDNRRASGHW